MVGVPFIMLETRCEYGDGSDNLTWEERIVLHSNTWVIEGHVKCRHFHLF